MPGSRAHEASPYLTSTGRWAGEDGLGLRLQETEVEVREIEGAR